LIDIGNNRNSTIARNRTHAALGRLTLHDRVRIGNRAKPRYLRGETETVRDLNDDYVVVLLNRLVGKFRSRHLRCAPEVVELAPDRWMVTPVGPAG